jgi:hypothetical protein
VPNSRSRSSRPSSSRTRIRDARSRSDGAPVEELEPAGRHQMDEQREIADSTASILPIRRTPSSSPPGERVERRVERLERDEPRRQRRLHARARRRRPTGGVR